jgi:type I restriction enzyme M protein
LERHAELANFIWAIADLLRHNYRPHEYGQVILPLTVLRRLDCVLEPTREKVLAEQERYKGKIANVEPILCNAAGQTFYNTSKYDFERLLADPATIADALRSYLAGFSPNAREIIDRFRFPDHIGRLDEANLLFLILQRFARIDLHPSTVDNVQMGYIYEELIRRFSEQSNETAGEHFTPREVIRLMVNLLFIEDAAVLREKGVVRTLYDPACGTGGMLSVAERHLRDLNPGARLELFGQEINAETFATCVSDMMVKGHETANVIFGNTFTEDGLAGRRFDYMLCNPPFGVDWKKYQKAVQDEADRLGWSGRFGAGLPRVSDGSLLFLQHMLARMKDPAQGGSRLAIVFNASPLFTGSAGSGESEIRRWIIESDWLEAIVALPDQLFYNTGISTYFWVVTNRKSPSRQGKVQLIDGRGFSGKMRKSLGNKRNELGEEHIAELCRIYGEMGDGEHSRVFPNEYFGYRRITVERPRRYRYQVTDDGLAAQQAHKQFTQLVEVSKASKDPAADLEAGEARQRAILAGLGALTLTTTDRAEFEKAIKKALAGVEMSAALRKAILESMAVHDDKAPIEIDATGDPVPDTDLRDNENVPLTEDVDEYMAREVLPYVPDAWVDHDKTRIGYEIPLTREFYVYQPPRPLEEIEAEIAALEAEIGSSLREVVE